ncbi:MAG: hypothetical protein EXS09_03750 [Gemmataceae bacterium]|nr:hypothetical protein [Gemmataceae bacterium]
MARIRILAFLLAAIVGCRSTYPSANKEETSPERTEGKTTRSDLSTANEAKTQKPAPVLAEAKDPEPIALALDCLDRGEDEAAARHLKVHVTRHADQVVFRAQLAELLLRLNRFAEAESEFEAAIASTQAGPPTAKNRLVHYHTRLMEIAREREDEYSEFLHRGIGLHLVACQLAGRGDPGDVERLLCKAATALKEAQTKRPEDARAAWYLYRVWSQLDQPRPAENALRQAIAAAPFSKLTPMEARELGLVSLATDRVLK